MRLHRRIDEFQADRGGRTLLRHLGDEIDPRRGFDPFAQHFKIVVAAVDQAFQPAFQRRPAQGVEIVLDHQEGIGVDGVAADDLHIGDTLGL